MAKCLDDATQPLRGDAELCREVRLELAAHLTDAAGRHVACGMEEVAGRARAIAEFGPPEEIARALARTHGGRLRRRAWLRRGLYGLGVPVACFLAVAMVWQAAQRAGGLVVSFQNLSEAYPFQPESHRWKSLTDHAAPAGAAQTRLPGAAAFLFLGDPSRREAPARQRAIWEAFPKNRVFYANYISALLADYKDSQYDAVLAELAHARAVDPDNARYEFIAAYLMARQAASLEPAAEGSAMSGGARSLVVRDAALMDRAMQRLRGAQDHAVYRRYVLDMLQRRLAALPPLRRMEDLLQRSRIASEQSQPDTSVLKDLARMAAAYGDVLARAGRPAEARRAREAWSGIAARLSDDAFCYVDLLAVREIVACVPADAARDQAAVARRVHRLIDSESEVATAGGAAAFLEIQERGSLYARLVSPPAGLPPYPPWQSYPAFGEPISVAQAGVAGPSPVTAVRADSLRFTRAAEQAVLEQLATAIAAAAFFLLMLGTALVALRHFRARGGDGRDPGLLLLLWKGWLEILGLGLALPVAMFAVYTLLSALSGRQYGLAFLGYRFCLELLALAAGVCALCRLLARRRLLRRCRELGLAAPRAAGAWRTGVGAFLFAYIAGVCLSMRGGSADLALRYLPAVAGLPALGLDAVRRALFCPARCASFHRAAALSALPIYAGAVICLAGVALPALRWAEADALRQEELFGWSTTDGFANTEYRRVLRLRGEIRKILNEPGV